MPVLTDSRTKVARDLRAIDQMHKQMLTEAVNAAGDPLMPGGLAMVSLANVANLEAFANLIDAAEHRAIQLADEYGLKAGELMPEIDGDDWEPPLQTLCFWSETWRFENGMVSDVRPTIASEVNFLRWAIDWAWEHESRWDVFVRDIVKTRARMEAILSEGQRPVARGVACMYDECHGARLIRATVPKSDKDGKKIWVLTDWHCPNCKRNWDEESYERNVYAAIHRAKTLLVQVGTELEIYCTVELAAQRVGRPQSTVRAWLHREQIAELCAVTNRRWRYVRLADVEERDRLASERWQKILTARAAKHPQHQPEAVA